MKINDEILEKLIKAGKIASEVREHAKEIIKPDMKLIEIANELERMIIAKGGYPAFPINLSINEEAAHYSPKINDERTVREGDLLKVDIGVHVDGYIADTAVSIVVGGSRPELERVIKATQDALEKALVVIGPGTSLEAIGDVIERTIRGYGYYPIVNLSGHQIERWNLHAGLSIPNYRSGRQKIPQEGVFAIEPFAVLNGRGVVKEGAPGGIYRVVRDGRVRDRIARSLFENIKERFRTLPFSERWCLEFASPGEVRRGLLVLQRYGLVMQYRVLKDVQGSYVAQSEHTVVIAQGEKYITTK